MMLRRIARPMLAAWFVTEGVAAVRGAPAHLEPARAGVDALAEPLGVTRPDDAQLRTIVQVHGGLTIAAGAALALGKAPRLAAVLLAVLTFPSVVANVVAARKATTTPATKADLQQRAVRALSFTGAALIAAADREGRPGLRWKMSHAKQLAAAGAATGIASRGKGGGTAGKRSGAKAEAVEGAEAGTAKAAKRARKAEKAAAAAAAGVGAAPVADAEAGSTAGSAAHPATPKRSELRAQRKAAESTRRADARAAKVAAAQAADAEKAARVAERAEAKTTKVTRRALRAEVKAAKRAAKDAGGVVAA